MEKSTNCVNLPLRLLLRMFYTILHSLEDSSWAVAVRRSYWLYPMFEIVHITGIALLVGPAFMFDLRLLGLSKNIPVQALAEHLLPWSRGSLLLIIPSGFLLFITNAATLGYDTVFHIKMLLLIVAGLNALVFHKFIFKRGPDANQKTLSAPFSKVAACVSMVVWLSIIACGRLLAY